MPYHKSVVSIDPDENFSHPKIKKNSSMSNLSNIWSVGDHPISQVIGDIVDGVHTRCQASSNFYMFANFISLIEPKKIDDTLNDAEWIRVMKDEFHEFKRHNVWTMVPCLKGKNVGTH